MCENSEIGEISCLKYVVYLLLFCDTMVLCQMHKIIQNKPKSINSKKASCYDMTLTNLFCYKGFCLNDWFYESFMFLCHNTQIIPCLASLLHTKIYLQNLFQLVKNILLIIWKPKIHGILAEPSNIFSSSISF